MAAFHQSKSVHNKEYRQEPPVASNEAVPAHFEKLSKEFSDVISKNHQLKTDLQAPRFPRLEIPGEGTYLGEPARQRRRELTAENREAKQRGWKEKNYKYDTVENNEINARDLIAGYTDDAAPKLTGDCKIRICK